MSYLSFSGRIREICQTLATARPGWSMTSDQVRERYDQVLWGACIKHAWVTWIPKEDRWYATPKVKEDWQQYDANKDRMFRSEARMGLPLTSYFNPKNYSVNGHNIGAVRKKKRSSHASAARNQVMGEGRAGPWVHPSGNVTETRPPDSVRKTK